MTKILLLIIATLCCVSSLAQNLDLSKMKKTERNQYLLTKAREAVTNFGPEYLREYKEPKISRLQTYKTSPANHEEWLRHNGRKYYTVTYLYDTTKEHMEKEYAAKVYIWDSDGEPMQIFFGCGIGNQFFTRSYSQWLKDGVTEHDIIPYRAYKENITIVDTFGQK